METYCFFTFFLVFVMVSTSKANYNPSVGISKTIMVDPTGKYGFSSVQAAINSVPLDNNKWITIQLKRGIYMEKICIPKRKGFILLQGEGMGNTIIESTGHYDYKYRLKGYRLTRFKYPIIDSKLQTLDAVATFTSLGSNIIVKNITFKNMFTSNTHGEIRQALAAYVYGDKISFYNCGFVSFQDTLCDMGGRHLFHSCYIEGAIDFIFGKGQSIYKHCTIYTIVGGQLNRGWITAQGRSSPNDPDGFIFKYCNITGPGPAYLGRPWGPYSRVVYYNTLMGSNVLPQGWDSWNYKRHEGQLFYVEEGSQGPGANNFERVGWTRKLSEGDLQWLISDRFIDDEGWLNQQPLG